MQTGEHTGRSQRFAAIAKLALPAFAQLLSATVIFVVDRILVGHYDTTALASLHLSSTLLWTVCSALGAVAVGALCIVGRAHGAGNSQQAAAAVRASLLAAVVLGTVTMAALGLSGSWLLQVFFPRAGSDVMSQANAYLAIVLPALPSAVFAAAAMACLHGMGDTRTPLRAGVVAGLLNLVLSGVLVFGLLGMPEMGVRGAAVGSALAFLLQAVWLGVALRDHLKAPPRMTLAMGRKLARVAFPALGDKLALHGAYFLFVALVGLLGSTAMATHQALLSAEALGCQLAEGIGIAAAIMAAQHLGAGRPQAARGARRTAAGLAVAVLCVMSLLLVIAPMALMSLLSSDESVVAAGVATLPYAALAQPFMAYAIVSTAWLRGAGATRTALGITLAGVAVRLSACWLFALHLDMGLGGMWLASALDWMAQSLVVTMVLERRSARREASELQSAAA